MNRVMCVVALGGLGAAASAQTLNVHVSFDTPTVVVGQSFTATMIASFDGHPAGAYLSSINIDVFGSQAWEVSNVSTIVWNNPALGFDGQPTASGGDVLGVEAAQFSLIPPVNSSNPLFVTSWTVTVTEITALEFTYTAAVAANAPYPFSVTGGAFADPAVPFGIGAFSSDRIITPAPGAFGLLGVGGLLAVRRRR